jgi:hypothetical protein
MKLQRLAMFVNDAVLEKQAERTFNLPWRVSLLRAACF